MKPFEERGHFFYASLSDIFHDLSSLYFAGSSSSLLMPLLSLPWLNCFCSCFCGFFNWSARNVVAREASIWLCSSFITNHATVLWSSSLFLLMCWQQIQNPALLCLLQWEKYVGQVFVHIHNALFLFWIGIVFVLVLVVTWFAFKPRLWHQIAVLCCIFSMLLVSSNPLLHFLK